MTQWPEGGVQSSVPSGRIFDVRFTTFDLETASLAAISGVATEYRSGSVANAAFSSTRLTRAPAWRTSSLISKVVGAVGALLPGISPPRPWAGGNVLKVTRKNRT